MNIYLASAYGRREEMMVLAEVLIGAGHTITSRWIHGNHDKPPVGIAVDSPEHHAWCATDDIEDIVASDAIVNVTGGGNRSRGGRHVEFGIGLSTVRRLLILGDRENVFHFLPGVEHCAGIDDLVTRLRGPRREDSE